MLEILDFLLLCSLIKHLKFEISDVGCMTLRNRAKVLFASPNRELRAVGSPFMFSHSTWSCAVFSRLSQVMPC